MVRASVLSKRLGLLVRAIRAPFLTAAAVPVLLGSAIAFRERAFNWATFVMVLPAMLLIHAGLNVLNDYFDYRSGNDNSGPKLTPFSGGSRLIQQGILTPAQTLGLSISCFAAGITLLMSLAILRSWGVWWLGFIGLALAVFYQAPPLSLSYLGHGLGELSVGIGFGPVIVLGVYYMHTLRLSSEVLWASVPVGMLIAAVVHVNEFPDYEQDYAVRKNTLVVVLGRERAVWSYFALMAGSYVAILMGIGLRVLPFTAVIALLTVPMAYQAMRTASRFHSEPRRLVPANAGTIQVHLVTGLLLSLAYLAAALVHLG